MYVLAWHVEYGVDAVTAVFHYDVIMGEDVVRDLAVHLRASRAKEYLARGVHNAVVTIHDSTPLRGRLSCRR